MFEFLVKRIATIVPTLMFVSMLIFGLQQLLPGDQALFLAGQDQEPAVVAYLQAETELTRSTIVRILTESNRLAEFLVNPQKYMDAVAVILKQQLHKLMIDGIKYAKVAGAEYSMALFEEKEVIGYLNNPLEVKNTI